MNANKIFTNFTFHNVSINTKMLPVTATVAGLFTFHNVSINTVST